MKISSILCSVSIAGTTPGLSRYFFNGPTSYMETAERVVDRVLTAKRVAKHYVEAKTEATLDELADTVVDALFNEIGPNAISEQDVSKALQAGGLQAKDLAELSEGKQAGGFLHALGGFVARGLWKILVQPFLAIGKLFSSPAFRTEVKGTFKKALRHEARATRHLLDVAERIALGQPVKPQERKAAMKQLLEILVKVLFLYFTGPTIAAMFSGGIWPTVTRLMLPVSEVITVLLDKPIRAATEKLMSAGLPVNEHGG